jgi:hypothetical protein
MSFFFYHFSYPFAIHHQKGTSVKCMIHEMKKVHHMLES